MWRLIWLFWLLAAPAVGTAQSWVAFQALDACPSWRCTVALAATVSLRLDRSIPWRLPVRQAARLSSGYGYRTDPLDGRRRFHAGVDLAAPLGCPVLAAGSGRVATGYDRNLGHYVTIDHLNGFVSTYGHLDRIAVTSGSVVGPQAVLGTVGQSGRTTGPHLHWSVSHVASGGVDPLAVRRLFLAAH